MHDRCETVRVVRLPSDQRDVQDVVAVEAPLEIRIGGQPLVVTMRTPGHDSELAAGLLLSERAVSSPHDIAGIRCFDLNGDRSAGVADVTFRAGARTNLTTMRRGALASTSCGVCGKASLEQLENNVEPLPDACRIQREVLFHLPAAMRSAQEVFDRTGGLHAAALFDVAGRLLCLREDVGRHNAVDKVLGWAGCADRWPLAQHVLVVSGRSSFEIVSKAAAARIPVVAGVSAASSLAVATAAAAGQTLIGFLRDRTMTVYTAPQRIANDVPPAGSTGTGQAPA